MNKLSVCLSTATPITCASMLQPSLRPLPDSTLQQDRLLWSETQTRISGRPDLPKSMLTDYGSPIRQF